MMSVWTPLTVWGWFQHENIFIFLILMLILKHVVFLATHITSKHSEFKRADRLPACKSSFSCNLILLALDLAVVCTSAPCFLKKTLHTVWGGFIIASQIYTDVAGTCQFLLFSYMLKSQVYSHSVILMFYFSLLSIVSVWSIPRLCADTNVHFEQ